MSEGKPFEEAIVEVLGEVFNREVLIGYRRLILIMMIVNNFDAIAEAWRQATVRAGYGHIDDGGVIEWIEKNKSRVEARRELMRGRIQERQRLLADAPPNAKGGIWGP